MIGVDKKVDEPKTYGLSRLSTTTPNGQPGTPLGQTDKRPLIGGRLSCPLSTAGGSTARLDRPRTPVCPIRAPTKVPPSSAHPPQPTPGQPPGGLERIIDFAVNTGLRLGRICEVRRADYRVDDQEQAYIYVAKDKNGDPIWKGLHGAIREMVEQRVSDCRFPGDYLFPGPREGYALGSINKWFPRVVRAAGKRHPELGLEYGCSKDGVTFHTLRHTFASHALQAGVSEHELLRMGNWRTPAMLKRYAHLSEEGIRESEAKLTAHLHISSQETDSARKVTKLDRARTVRKG